MRKGLFAMILVVSAVPAASTVSSPAHAQYLHCVKGRGCLPTTEASYNACFNLALRRGLNVSRGDRRNLDSFIYQCLAGRIPG
jgi:hypothetical protein